MRKCTYCGQEKELELFSKNNFTKDGYLAICKLCFNERAKTYRKKGEKKPASKTSGLKLGNTTKKDWCLMFAALEKMGYDLTRDIHQQFCEKHNLPPRKRKPSEKLITYIPSDCTE